MLAADDIRGVRSFSVAIVGKALAFGSRLNKGLFLVRVALLPDALLGAQQTTGVIFRFLFFLDLSFGGRPNGWLLQRSNRRFTRLGRGGQGSGLFRLEAAPGSSLIER